MNLMAGHASRDYMSQENMWDARIRRPTLLMNPITSIGRNMQAFSPVDMQNIWWVHKCALVQITMQKEDPYICMT
jgi:hypothetical protein